MIVKQPAAIKDAIVEYSQARFSNWQKLVNDFDFLFGNYIGKDIWH